MLIVFVKGRLCYTILCFHKHQNFESRNIFAGKNRKNVNIKAVSFFIYSLLIQSIAHMVAEVSYIQTMQFFLS